MGDDDPGPVEEEPRRFFLHRWADASGVSGTGRIAYGVAWSDGRAITRWIGSTTGVQQICVWDSVDEILRIHGHGGQTEIHWLDDAPVGHLAALAPSPAEPIS
ncbi:hypothetical protein [Phytomonospora endophytica]|uniref:Uncharacterized protein n=1 Tax=Phytomonospora endophytica TaxID=714109 RepID=A0A841FSI1_9ACTN|nr:hypothetical protein [Phytomonospora endophytica]MBB6036267.1 hypothetical protein [Phytomonospora endophytica]GIG67174.1 hypothetical protein Pen01_34690 [Phytomonospora endophytica]